jgi:hypothetical protein
MVYGVIRIQKHISRGIQHTEDSCRHGRVKFDQ